MRAVFVTELGEIEVVLDEKRAPVSVKNFLRYVAAKAYDGGFKAFPPIALERTNKTGIKHKNGVLSMARDTPGSATEAIFICVGDQPELDFGGKRNPDGQGFAAFCKVTRGMDVVKKIHKSKAEGQSLTPKITIKRVVLKK